MSWSRRRRARAGPCPECGRGVMRTRVGCWVPVVWWIARWLLRSEASAFVVDVFTRRILGWRVTISRHAHLVIDAIHQADQMRRLEVVSRLFERLAHHGIDQRLALFKMPGRLIEGQTGFGFFLNQQELAVALDNSGDGDIRFPDHRDLPKAKTIILPADFG